MSLLSSHIIIIQIILLIVFIVLSYWIFFRCPPPPVMLANPEAVSEAIKLLASAKRPLVIVGKGAAYGRAEDQVNNFITRSGLPFLPTPMGNICFI